jgi:hypothetical protein
LSDGDKKAILSAYPRLDMKNQLTTCLCGIAKNHPNTTRDNFSKRRSNNPSEERPDLPVAPPE